VFSWDSFYLSIFISSKAIMYRISVELLVSIRIRCILLLAFAKLNTKTLICRIDTPAYSSSENPMIWVSHFVDFEGFCTE
jgi:hypothetical protein